jgi:hypothetical protein
MTTREQENRRIDKARPALADALEAADWPAVAADVRDGRSLQGIARDLRELGEGESWAHETVCLVANGAEPPSVEQGRAEARKITLERLAEEHGVRPTRQNSSGEDYLAALANPEQLRDWCAVTTSPETGITYLYPHYENAVAAKRKAEEHTHSLTFAETPVEVVNLDTGERFGADLGTVAWLDADGSPTFPDALARFKDAARVLAAAWGEEQVDGYPASLPSFDEFVAELADFKVAQ